MHSCKIPPRPRFLVRFLPVREIDRDRRGRAIARTERPAGRVRDRIIPILFNLDGTV